MYSHRCIVPEDKIQKLWHIFLRYDRDKKGMLVNCFICIIRYFVYWDTKHPYFSTLKTFLIKFSSFQRVGWLRICLVLLVSIWEVMLQDNVLDNIELVLGSKSENTLDFGEFVEVISLPNEFCLIFCFHWKISSDNSWFAPSLALSKWSYYAIFSTYSIRTALAWWKR